MMRGIVEVIADDDIRHIMDNSVTASFISLTPVAMRDKLGSELGEPRDILRMGVSHYNRASTTGIMLLYPY